MNDKPTLQRAVERQIQRAPDAEKAKINTQQALWPELLTAKQLLERPPDPTRWIWDKCLPIGSSSLLVAKPKIGKSTLAVCLALSVARGMKFLNRDTQQGPVAYLSLDAHLEEIADTFLHFGISQNDPVFIHAGSAPGDATAWLIYQIQNKGIKFAVIDTLQMFFRFQNLNDYSEVTRLTEPMLEAARVGGCHLMFTHHAKKESLDDLDSAVGTTALRGRIYQFLHLKKLPDSETRIFRSEGRGGLNFKEYAVGFNKFGFIDLQGTREEAEIAEMKPKIRDWFESIEEATEREMYSQHMGQPKITSRALRELFKDGELERTGKGKRGDPFRYCLAGKLSLVSDQEKKPRYSPLYSGKERQIKQKLFSENSIIESDTYSALLGVNKADKAVKQNQISNKAETFSPTLADKLLAEIDAEKSPKGNR